MVGVDLGGTWAESLDFARERAAAGAAKTGGYGAGLIASEPAWAEHQVKRNVSFLLVLLVPPLVTTRTSTSPAECGGAVTTMVPAD